MYGIIVGGGRGGGTARRLWSTVVATVLHNPRGSMSQTTRIMCFKRVSDRRRRHCTEIVEHCGGHSVPQHPWKHAANKTNDMFLVVEWPNCWRRRPCTEIVEHGGGHSVPQPPGKYAANKTNYMCWRVHALSDGRRGRPCTESVEHCGGHSVPHPPWKHAANTKTYVM